MFEVVASSTKIHLMDNVRDAGIAALLVCILYKRDERAKTLPQFG